jgi:hypothetical protein
MTIEEFHAGKYQYLENDPRGREALKEPINIYLDEILSGVDDVNASIRGKLFTALYQPMVSKTDHWGLFTKICIEIGVVHRSLGLRTYRTFIPDETIVNSGLLDISRPKSTNFPDELILNCMVDVSDTIRANCPEGSDPDALAKAVYTALAARIGYGDKTSIQSSTKSKNPNDSKNPSKGKVKKIPPPRSNDPKITALNKDIKSLQAQISKKRKEVGKDLPATHELVMHIKRLYEEKTLLNKRRASQNA